MKSPLFATLAFCALAFPAMAETVSSTVSPTVSVTPTAPVTAAIVISGTNILLPVVIDKTDGEKKLEARLVNLQSAGVELGMEAMILEGEAAASDSPEGGKDYAISWGTASLRTKAGGKVSTYITKPLQSNVSANPAVKGGDSFTAEGDPAELLAAWKRLQEKLKDEDKEEKEDAEKKTDAPAPTKDFGENAKEPEQKQQTQTPQFQVKPDPVTVSTRDGCSMNVDFDQMVAIVQERTLQDGKEVAACQDTLTRYPLEKKYTSCPSFVDLDAKKVYKQFTLSYNDPVSGGAIQVKDCSKDVEQVTPITLDTASCSLRNDFTAGKSIQQGRMVYTDSNGTIQELQSCTDTDITYPHIKTDDTCNDVVDEANKLVTHQYRYKINKDGMDEFVSQCEPDMATSTPLQEEICTSPRYTNDFAANTSYLNKSYFYNNTQGDRVDVTHCQASTTSFQHKKEEGTCTASNDDSTRQTTMYAKTYIEETAGDKVYLSDCQPITPKVPYVNIGQKWIKTSGATQGFKLNADESGALADWLGTLIRNTNSPMPIQTPTMAQVPWRTQIQIDYWTNKPGLAINGQEFVINTRNWYYYTADSYGYQQQNIHDSSFGGSMSCLKPKSLPWITTGGLTVDSANSTETPTTNTTYALSNFSMNSSGGKLNFNMNIPTNQNGTGQINFQCGAPTCTLSQFAGRNVYRRGDNTEFVDTSVSTGTQAVCGDGSNLDGENHVAMKATKPPLDPLERDPLMRNKLLHLKPYLSAKNLVEIRINQPGMVIQTFADGKKVTKPDPKLSFDYLENMGKILANLTYQRFSEDKPILACKLPGGHRVQIVAYESVASSFAMVIRIKRQVVYSLDDFGLSRTEQKGVLNAIANNKTILVSGGTGTGKTSLTNSLIPHIPLEQRILTIEGVAELVVPHEDWCALTYSENKSGISSNGAAELLRASLRLSPDRILLGEIHTENAAVFASAINTGHEGSIATIHANNPRAAIVALISKMIVNGSIDSGSIGIVQRQLCEDIHGIIQIDRDAKTHRRKAYFETMDRLAGLDLKSDVAKEVQQNGHP